MNYDEFAFFNQQLAAMLREGIPLEGALHRLSADMRDKRLQTEIQLLEGDLRNGLSLRDALKARKLPDFYVQMLMVGVNGNDLLGVLLLVADYYQRANTIWTRLKGLLVYPLIVLIAAFALSTFITILGTWLIGSDNSGLFQTPIPPMIMINLWGPPILTGAMLLGILVILLVPQFRRGMRWRLPAFKEAKLAQTASAMSLLLNHGGNLYQAIGLVRQLEANSPASRELDEWQERLSNGDGKFSGMAARGVVFPPLFLWLVGNAGEDLVGGFRRAAEIYGARAVYRVEMFLYAALPFSIIALGFMIVCQIFPLLKIVTGLMNGIDSVGN
ncbi:type II secretion system F family protein [Pedosphaera parvula]|uniref:Type II secretion system protein n=1 Tax=Pedosphaera parvula (strain Ellin514) TaxID=320771 RepID=B9XSX4_PEDPL|nr:type II secretion system F family protein [Pedosphaera parvula]EEF57058.1 type II secretion system protein [Pedosphaera parvula Ellin514]